MRRLRSYKVFSFNVQTSLCCTSKKPCKELNWAARCLSDSLLTLGLGMEGNDHTASGDICSWAFAVGKLEPVLVAAPSRKRLVTTCVAHAVTETDKGHCLLFSEKTS